MHTRPALVQQGFDLNSKHAGLCLFVNQDEQMTSIRREPVAIASSSVDGDGSPLQGPLATEDGPQPPLGSSVVGDRLDIGVIQASLATVRPATSVRDVLAIG